MDDCLCLDDQAGSWRIAFPPFCPVPPTCRQLEATLAAAREEPGASVTWQEARRRTALTTAPETTALPERAVEPAESAGPIGLGFTR